MLKMAGFEKAEKCALDSEGHGTSLWRQDTVVFETAEM